MPYLITRHDIADAPEWIIDLISTGTGDTGGVAEASKRCRMWTRSDRAGDAVVRSTIGTKMGVNRGGYAVACERVTGEVVASEGISLWCSVEVSKVRGWLLVVDGNGTRS